MSEGSVVKVRRKLFHPVVAVGLVLLGAVFYWLLRPVPGAKDRARAAETTAKMAVVAMSLDMFQKEHGRFPTDDEGLAVLTQSGCTGGSPYLESASLIDGWGEMLVYQRLTDSHVTITSVGSQTAGEALTREVVAEGP